MQRPAMSGGMAQLTYLVLAGTLLLGGCSGEGGDFISGTVSGPAGPEAGVWVIAVREDLPTR
jgi:hypothetical protein